MNVPMDLAGWLGLVAELAAKSTLVLLIAGVAAALLWRASAAARHAAWCLGVAGVLALPVLSLLLPTWEAPLLPDRLSTASAVVAPALAGPAATAQVSMAEASPEAARAPAPPGASPRTARADQRRSAWLPRAAAVLLAAGMLGCLGWLAAGFWGVSRLGRRSELVTDPAWLQAAQQAAQGLGLRRPVLLLRSPGTLMPATWGLVWPAVIVPAAADGWPLDRRRAVLAHELAHVKRFDCLTQALAQAACALFWWHPGVWYAARRLRVERERACDDLVLRGGTPPREYAHHLLEVARACRRPRIAAPALVPMATPSHLESRLRWVLDGARPRAVPSRRAVALAVAAGVLVVAPLAGMRPANGRAPTWSATEKGGRVQILFRWDDSRWARGVGLDELRGLSDLEVGGLRSTRVSFRMEREPGRLALDGRFRDGRGAGRFRFHPDRGFAAALRTLGVRGADEVSDRQLLALALAGVSARSIRELQALGLDSLSVRQLITLAVFDATPAYVRSVRALGISGTKSVDGIVELRRFGVTPAYVRELEALGYRGLSRQQLLLLRMQGVSPTFIRNALAAGNRRLSPEDLVRLKSPGIVLGTGRERNNDEKDGGR